MTRRYYFRVVKYCFQHEKIIFISSSYRVMFFLLYGQRTYKCICMFCSVGDKSDNLKVEDKAAEEYEFEIVGTNEAIE